MYDTAILHGLVYVDDSFAPLNVYIEEGKIALLSTDIFDADKVIDADGNLVIPGIIDPHTHFQLQLPTVTSRDDFYSGTKAGLYGGVTTIIDFLDPVQTGEALERAFEKRLNQASTSFVDFTFHACVRNPKGHISDIVDAMTKLDIKTVKLFTTYSDSDRRTYEPEIRELLELSAPVGFTVLAHIEDDNQIDLNESYTYRDLPISRPTSSETIEALRMAQLAKETNGKLYMVHLSSGDTLRALEEKYNDILHTNMMIESCPHYFMFHNGILNQDNGYLYTMAPPLRSIRERNLLYDLIDHVDTIGTDHCSFNKSDKQQQLLRDTPLGIGGVEFSFPVMHHLFGNAIINKMTKNVAIHHHLYPQKGVLQEGSDADLFVYRLGTQTIHQHHGNTDYNPYDGVTVSGQVTHTVSRGVVVLEEGTINKNKGHYIHRGK